VLRFAIGDGASTLARVSGARRRAPLRAGGAAAAFGAIGGDARDSVAAGFGVGRAPGSARRFSYDGVVFVAVRPRVPVRLFAVRARRRPAPAVERFLELLRAGSKADPPAPT
jgi:hypothetical protein